MALDFRLKISQFLRTGGLQMRDFLLRLICFVMVLTLAACSSPPEPLSEEMIFTDSQSLTKYVDEIFENPEDIPLFHITMDMNSAELYDIRLVGNHIYYRYILNGYTLSDVPDILSDVKNTFSIGWNYTKNGSDGLEYFVTSNVDAVSKVEGYSGLYSSDILDDNGKVVGKMLYWVQDDCQFSASVPNEILEGVITSIYSDTPLAKKKK